MLRRVALVRTDVSEERIASLIRVTRMTRIGLLDVANVVPSSPIFATMIIEAIHSSENSVLTRTTRRNIPEYGILQTILYSCICFKFFMTSGMNVPVVNK
jgi:hypothetical protein